VVPLVMYGITVISKLQLWTQPLWIGLAVLPFIAVLLKNPQAYRDFTTLVGGVSQSSGFDALMFGAAATVAFSLVVQIGEQVDYLRFLPEKTALNRGKWWAAVLIAGAGWIVPGMLKMLGGAFLCFEGAEKGLEMLGMHHHAEEEAAGGEQGAEAMEAEKIAGAIKTDFILSAEIMAISLAAVPDNGFWMQFAVLLAVGVGITGAVYGAVALIVKADDAGLALAQQARPLSRILRSSNGPSLGDRLVAPLSQALGRLLVLGMPVLLKLLSVIGTLAMLWVGGGINARVTNFFRLEIENVRGSGRSGQKRGQGVALLNPDI
jgi:predicted DNA repair protein MutK